MSRGQRRDVQWADGIRGIASLFIVTGHCVRAIIPNYLSPADDYDETPHLFQRPFLRVIAAGPFWTSIFFLLSGYVCAIKPLRLSAAGQSDEARRVIASSAFRRLLRIGVPATLGTTFAWILCHLGAFRLSGSIEYYSGWLLATTPEPVQGFIPAVADLILQCFNTWATSENSYEGNQWTLCWEMRGSMLVFLVLGMTAGFTIFWRRFMLLCAAIFYFKSGELMAPFCFFSGAILAELTLTESRRMTINTDVRVKRWYHQHWPLALATLAMLLASVPPENAHYRPYSRIIYYWFDDHITTTGGETDRTIGAFGGIMLIFAIMNSPLLKRFLSQPLFVYLGGISFPLYLLHGTWIRVFLTWGIYRFLAQWPSLNTVQYFSGWDGQPYVWMLCDNFTCQFAVSVVFCIWLASLLAFCRIWKDYVDVVGVQVSRWGEDVVLGKKPFIDIDAFPEVRTDWLMLGRSSLMRDTEKVL